MCGSIKKYIMKKLCIILSIFSLSQVSGNCRNGWVGYQRSCYLISDTKQSFGGAQSICQSFDGHLVNIGTSAEYNFLRTKLLDKYENSGMQFWTGGNDIEVEGDYHWIDTKDRLNITFWGHGQPDYHAYEDCISINMNDQAHWHDSLCDAAWLFVCENSQGSSYSPAFG